MTREWFSAGELAGVAGMPGTERSINRAGERGEINRRKKTKGKGWEYEFASLPPATQAALLMRSAPATPAARKEQPSSDAIWHHYERSPNSKKERAAERLKVLDAVEHLVGKGLGRTEAIETVAQLHGKHPATLHEWLRIVSGYARADWLAALTPRYAGRTKTAEISPSAWDFFRADYLRLEEPAATACYERLGRVANEQQWIVPSLKTIERKVKREIPRQLLILARKGTEALKRAYPAQERDHAWYHAMEAVNADGHKFDVFTRWHDDEIVRPVLVAWQDIYSGKILSWRVEKTESSCGYRLSFGDMIERYGIPEHAYLDNGRGIAAKHLTGGSRTRFRFKIRKEDPVGLITQLVGAEGVHWASPYHGQSKPIERAFRDFAEYVAKHPAFTGAYTGKHPMAKPENYQSRAIPIATFLKVLEQEVIAHNARAGRLSAVCAGRHSFDTAFSASYEKSLIRKASAEQRRLWLLAAEAVTASRQDGSIAIEGNRHWCEELAQYAGKKVVVRFDPDRLHGAMHAYTLDGRYIGQAECIQAAGFGDRAASREHARQLQRWTRGSKQMLEAELRMSALDAAAMLPELNAPDDPGTKTVQLVQPERKRAVGSDVRDTELEEHNSHFEAAVLGFAEHQKKTRLP